MTTRTTPNAVRKNYKWTATYVNGAGERQSLTIWSPDLNGALILAGVDRPQGWTLTDVEAAEVVPNTPTR